jgi:DNA mismatch repair protein MSH3
MVELTETCEILKAATARSLIVLDELGRGTSTNDGLAIAHAVLQYIVKRLRCQTLFITHFPQLAELAAVSCNTHQKSIADLT